MKKFLDDDFLLHTDTAKKLYNYAAGLPIIDYHNHLSSADIAIDKKFKNITELWLKDDHYKWRAMRANGIAEKYITGHATDEEKFFAWAETVPFTVRNPLFHWTHLELKRYFNIDELLNESSAKRIYTECNTMLHTNEYSTKNLLRKMHVEVLCTTDDPCDRLEHHQQIKQDGFEIKVLPTFRADKIIAVENLHNWLEYLRKLSAVSNTLVHSFSTLLHALKKRHDFFAENGCCISDHGMNKMVAAEYSDHEVENIFQKLFSGHQITEHEQEQFKSALLYQLALMDKEKNWVQQYHVGALRNTNSRLKRIVGEDAGVDSIGDINTAENMAAFFDKLDSINQLPKTIIYNVNPAQNEVYASMAGNFNDGSVAGKMQYGSAWWFSDQKNGIEKQLNVLSDLGLLSRFIGMTTDSRSFLSFTRHEYFRRILCNLIGTDIENGEIPGDENLSSALIKNICYYNERNYFNF